MLSRVADNLYWLGRYIERCEQISRYLNIQYFSSLDTDFELQKEIALKSVAHMVGLDTENYDDYTFEEDILVSVAMDDEGTNSIKSCVHHARENARGARDVISVELWNAVNKFYRFIHDYPEDYYKTKGLYDFTQTTNEHCSIIKNKIGSSLLHDQVWAFITAGLNIERATQVNRMLLSKFNDIEMLTEHKATKSIESFQWAMMLKSVEGFDMFRREYSRLPNQQDVLEFVVLSLKFPRSISYNINSLCEYFNLISRSKNVEENSLEWSVGKMSQYLKYKTIDEIKDKPVEFLMETLTYLNDLNTLLTKSYLNY
ncbi:alpha-E domain-containing protein [Reichenbachiella versicolor]|uniref:alpha-E domain-containing protein n=1 Tax=Reichenbachiella versicolor TaxID=1821036 RepID=UPI000D6E8688|nr:alpha-E domain-containing protein [Reichenbachiella versicolor]